MDVVICNFPPMLPWYLPAAPAILAGACKWLDLTSTVIDFNIEFYKDACDISKWADTVLAHTPTVVALSIFSYKSRPYAIELAKELKQKNPNIIITAGGPGISDVLNISPHQDFQYCVNQKIIDHYIQTDGEYQFPKYLTEVFNLIPIDPFNNMSPPYLMDYSTYDFKFYKQHAIKNKSSIYIPLNGSKGCVRNCTYCAIPSRWEFTQRLPTDIVAEIKNILLIEDDIHIHFTDSLVNGTLPSFNELLDLLIEVKKDYPKFNWGGQFIIRRANQSGDEYWEKISQSGAQMLEIGIETGSDRLRYEMKKHFTNEDLMHSVRLMEKYKVECVFLMFTGMPTETEDDFTKTLELLTACVPYKDTVIKELQLGYLTTINPKTPLYKSNINNTAMILTKDPVIWFNKDNPTLTFEQRIERRRQFEAHAIVCGYKTSWDTHLQIQDAEETYFKNQNLIKLIEKQK